MRLTLGGVLEFPVDMVWQGFALLDQLVHKGGVVRFDEPCLATAYWLDSNIRSAEVTYHEAISAGREHLI